MWGGDTRPPRPEKLGAWAQKNDKGARVSKGKGKEEDIQCQGRDEDVRQNKCCILSGPYDVKSISLAHARESRPISGRLVSATIGEESTNLRCDILRRWYPGLGNTWPLSTIVGLGAQDLPGGINISFSVLWEVAGWVAWNYMAQCFAFYSGGFVIDARFSLGGVAWSASPDPTVYPNTPYQPSAVAEILIARTPVLAPDGSHPQGALAQFNLAVPTIRADVLFGEMKALQFAVPGSHIVSFMDCATLSNDIGGHPAAVYIGGRVYSLVTGLLNYTPSFYANFTYSFTDDFTFFWKVGPPTMNLNPDTDNPIFIVSNLA